MQGKRNLRIRKECLHSHGAGTYHAVSLLSAAFGKGVRLSHGAYGFQRGRFTPHWERYRLTATHFGIGAFTISIIHGRIGWRILQRVPFTSPWRYMKAQRRAQADA